MGFTELNLRLQISVEQFAMFLKVEFIDQFPANGDYQGVIGGRSRTPTKRLNDACTDTLGKKSASTQLISKETLHDTCTAGPAFNNQEATVFARKIDTVISIGEDGNSPVFADKGVLRCLDLACVYKHMVRQTRFDPILDSLRFAISRSQNESTTLPLNETVDHLRGFIGFQRGVWEQKEPAPNTVAIPSLRSLKPPNPRSSGETL